MSAAQTDRGSVTCFISRFLSSSSSSPTAFLTKERSTETMMAASRVSEEKALARAAWKRTGHTSEDDEEDGHRKNVDRHCPRRRDLRKRATLSERRQSEKRKGVTPRTGRGWARNKRKTRRDDCGSGSCRGVWSDFVLMSASGSEQCSDFPLFIRSRLESKCGFQCSHWPIIRVRIDDNVRARDQATRSAGCDWPGPAAPVGDCFIFSSDYCRLSEQQVSFDAPKNRPSRVPAVAAIPRQNHTIFLHILADRFFTFRPSLAVVHISRQSSSSPGSLVH